MVSTLVIGGSQAIRDAFDRHLRSEGFEPTFANSGKEGLELAARGLCRLIILDLALPDMPGTEVLRRLEQTNQTQNLPVVVVTHVDTEIDRIVAFELGAVDYVCEPFSVRELLLRLRVAAASKTAPASRPGPDHAPLVLDHDARAAVVRDTTVILSPREFALLAALQARSGDVCSRGQLRDAVWGQDSVSLRTVDASVKRLRQKLGPAGRSIETVRGVGYRFRQTSVATLPASWAASRTG